MPTQNTAQAGAPCWVDLMTSDTQRSRAFYSDLFGWVAEEPNAEFGGYFNFRKNGVRVAGCMAAQPDTGVSDVWSVYLTTDDAVKTVELAAANGGQVVVPAMQVAELGTIAVLSDCGAAAIGAWQPGTHTGFGLARQDGTPGWFELHTRDYAAAVNFYRDVFGWDTRVMSDTREFRYTVLQDGEEMLAGILDAAGALPDGVPAHWQVYFSVDDADAALAKIVELGGSVVRPAEGTPWGRIAQATDSTGASFKLVAPNEAMPARAPSA